MKGNKFINLISYMSMAKVTKCELAKCIGIARTSLYCKLRGEIDFRLKEMLVIQEVLNERLDMKLTIEELFFENDLSLLKSKNKLIGYRNMCGLTQMDMAKIIGKSNALGYARKETGKIPFKADEMQAIRNEFNSRLNMELTIDELFF